MKTNSVEMKRLSDEEIAASKVIVLANNKGGCGKTSTAIALGLYYVRMGKNVLFVDVDPQSNMTQRLGLSDEQCRDSRVGQLFRNAHIPDYPNTQKKHSQIVQYPYIYRVKGALVNKTGRIGLIPGEHGAEIEADAASKRLINDRFIEPNMRDLSGFFKRCIDFYRQYFHIIILDTAPALEGNSLNRVAISNADDIVCPVDGLEAASGLAQLMVWIKGVASEKKPRVVFPMIKYQLDPDSRVADKEDPRLRNNVYRAMKDAFGNFVCDNGVREQSSLRRSVAMFGRKTDYLEMCREISEKISAESDSIFDVMTREKYDAFEKVLSEISNKARDKDPVFKAPRYG